MEATLLLADAAQATPDGKVSALGIGWSLTPTPTPPSAVVVLAQFPMSEVPSKVKVQLDLVYKNGEPVLIAVSPQDSTRLHIEQEIDIKIVPDHNPESSISVPFVVALGPLPLRPGCAFEWVLTIDGRTWHVPFWTRALNEDVGASGVSS